MKLPLWLLAWMLVIELFLVILLVPSSWVESVIHKESQNIEGSLGEETAGWIRGIADDWYQTTMLDSGAYQAIYRHVIPSKEEQDASKGMEGFGDTIWPWVEKRIDALMHLIYQVYARVGLFLVWAPYMLILVVPSVFHGSMVWRIKQTNFDYASPIFHRYGARMLAAITQLVIIVFFIPLALNPLIIPMAMMASAVMLGVTISNFQKRV